MKKLNLVYTIPMPLTIVRLAAVMLVALVVLSFSGCALNNMSLVRLPSDQERSISEIASIRDDGNPPMKIGEINALQITPGGLNPPGKILRVAFVLNIKKSGPRYYFLGIATLDVNNCAESECIRVIDNFRKAGLPPEFTELSVTAELPGEYRSTDFKSYGESTFCAYVIDREQLMNGSPPRQTFKNFQHIQ
jgi:hypothetical protein